MGRIQTEGSLKIQALIHRLLGLPITIFNACGRETAAKLNIPVRWLGREKGKPVGRRAKVGRALSALLRRALNPLRELSRAIIGARSALLFLLGPIKSRQPIYSLIPF